MSLSSKATATGAGGRHGSPWRAVGVAVITTLALVGAGMVGASLDTEPGARPPQPVAEAAPTDLGAATAAPPSEATPTDPPVGLPRSEPTGISIPRIGVDAEIMSLGVREDGTLEVPPLEQAQLAGWYRLGASPGEVGNAVVVGHVDSAQIGPAVFFNLGALLPGDTIQVTRTDETVATFTVDEVRSYPKSDFPTELVYGPNDTPSLRVVTCGGVFDEEAGSYPDNIVVTATLTP